MEGMAAVWEVCMEVHTGGRDMEDTVEVGCMADMEEGSIRR